MKINLQTLHFDATDELKSFVEEKVNKLGRFDSSIMSAEVTLTDEGSGIESKTCDIRLVIPGNDDFVKKTAATFEEAISESVNVLLGMINARK